MKDPGENSLSPASFRESLSDHLAEKAAEARALFGPQIGWTELLRMLEDRTLVRYPCEVLFDGGPLLEDECAHPVQKGEHPRDGFVMHVHPRFESRKEDAVALVLYQLVLVNYGDFASTEDAETFGAGVLDMSKESYYRRLCRLADELAPPQGCS